MTNLRLIALASALALFLPAAAVALPNMWPTDDPSALVVEGGAEEFVNATFVSLENPPQWVTDMNTTLGHEQLVEGHTAFATIDIVKNPVWDNGSVEISAVLECAASAGWDGPRLLGVPLPFSPHTSTVHCLQNASLVAMPNPLYMPGYQSSSLVPNGIVYPFTTPLGEVGYETEYTYDISYQDPYGGVRHETRYAWSASPVHPWVDDSGHVRSLYMTLPREKLAEMGVHDFSIVDARTLDISQ